MTHVLYRFYSATGQLLYVGITANPPMRFKAHRHTKDWWPEVVGITLERYATRGDLANAERRAIQVERPLHNVAHVKRREGGKFQPVADEPPPTHDVLTDDELASIFVPPPSDSMAGLADLFGGEVRRDTRYGYVTDEEYRQRAEEYRAKLAARDECTLCDSDGYRNMRVCNHIDYRGGSPLREAHKRQLRVVQGGGA